MKSLGLGPAPPSRLAANPENEIRDASELFLLPYTPSTSTRTCLFPAHRHRLFAGRVPDGVLPIRTGDPRVSRRATIASADRLRTRGLVGPSLARDDLPLTPLSRSSSIPVRAFRGARDPIRRDSPRPLPLRRRDATKFSPVQSAFVRQEMRCSSSTLSGGDCASSALWIRLRAPPQVPRRPFEHRRPA